MAMQAMGGMTARAMAGRGAMQQQQVQATTMAKENTRQQNQAQVQTQTQSSASAPEMSTGRVMNTSDTGHGQQNGNQAAAMDLGRVETQFSERAGVSYGGKG